MRSKNLHRAVVTLERLNCNALRPALAFLAFLGLVALLGFPLAWKQQVLLGIAMVVGALFLHRLSRHPIVTMALMAISVFSTLRYGYWRLSQTAEGVMSFGHLRQPDTLFVLLLLIAELYAFLTLVLGYFQTLRPLSRPPLPLTGDPAEWPTVDMLIPTYNEPLSVVRTTVLGALGIDYPAGKATVYLLDDGRRKEFHEFALSVGAKYITRNNNAHAKAGNINHALLQTSGQFVAIFDSDHIPTNSFLKATLGWFISDSSLGMVQTPHHFYSPDPFERNLGLFHKIPNEGELFHRLVQDGNDLWNASFFCGSCAVLRRSALDEIGGIAVETVTEDAHTALRMQCKGWNTAYINLPQAAGLATESLAAHIGQRIRWARGMVQILRIENPLFKRGLTLPQRLCYFNATTHFLYAIPRLIFLTVPLVYLLLGRVNIYGYSLAVFAYAFPHIILSNLTNSRVQGGYRFSFWNEIYETVLAPYILIPTLLALINPRLGKFNVTSKGDVVGQSYFDLRIALPFLFLWLLNAIGLCMAVPRYRLDAAHRDTVIMNVIWTIYNLIILSVSASVAWETRQRRELVRVDLRVPFMLMTSSGEALTGITTQLSRHGASGELSRPVEFDSGASVLFLVNGPSSRCQVMARIVHSAGCGQRLRFSALNLRQERELVGLLYSQAEALLSWQKLRPGDRPFRSLLHIFGLSLRGVFVVSRGLCSAGLASKLGEVRPDLATLLLVAMLLLPMKMAHGAAAEAKPKLNATAAESVQFQDAYELSAFDVSKPIAMQGEGVSQNVFFGIPSTKVVRHAMLELHYSAPAQLIPGESSLDLMLNDSAIGSISLEGGSSVQTQFELPSDLLTTDNALALKLRGKCEGCKGKQTPSISIDQRSRLIFKGTNLPLKNDLSMLPEPFFDRSSSRAWEMPVVFSESPTTETLQAAAVVTSWLGAFSDFRGVRFPVYLNELPSGNVVVLVMRGTALAKELSLPASGGAALAICDHPFDPYGKLLIIAGDRPEELLTAARALVTRSTEPKADMVYVSSAALPAQGAYDAPRWLQSNKPAPIGTYTTADRLKLNGTGSINIYFRLPPDLYLQAQQTVPLRLNYEYAGVAPGSRATLNVRLNGETIGDIPLKSSSSRVVRSDIVELPTGKLQFYTNTLTVDFDFGRKGPSANVWPYAAVGRESSIDLRELPHSVFLPKLELFAQAGYPFTQSPDLSQTAVAMPDAPTVSECEELLDLAGYLGAQTGMPAAGIVVTDARRVGLYKDRNLILLGSPSSQPLLSEWSNDLPLKLSDDGIELGKNVASAGLLHPQWTFRSEDRRALAKAVGSNLPVTLAMEGLVSPLRSDRSVIVLASYDRNSALALSAIFLPYAHKGPVYGGVALLRGDRFQSYLVGTSAYRSGSLSLYEHTRILLLESYWVIPLCVIGMSFVVALWVYLAVERLAARRLDAARPSRARA